MVGKHDFSGLGWGRPGAVGLAHHSGAHQKSTSALQCACANKRATHVRHITDHVVAVVSSVFVGCDRLGSFWFKCVGPSDWIIKLLTDWRVRLLVAHQIQNHLIFKSLCGLFWNQLFLFNAVDDCFIWVTSGGGWSLLMTQTMTSFPSSSFSFIHLLSLQLKNIYYIFVSFFLSFFRHWFLTKIWVNNKWGIYTNYHWNLS